MYGILYFYKYSNKILHIYLAMHVNTQTFVLTSCNISTKDLPSLARASLSLHWKMKYKIGRLKNEIKFLCYMFCKKIESM